MTMVVRHEPPVDRPGFGRSVLWYECLRKKAFKRKRDAIARMNSYKDPGLHVYLCHHCATWHVGHRSRLYS